jgi:hypothetical protein
MIESQLAPTSRFTPEELALIQENEMIVVELSQIVKRLEVLKRRLDANCGYVAPAPWPPRAKVASTLCTSNTSQQVAVAS